MDEGRGTTDAEAQGRRGMVEILRNRRSVRLLQAQSYISLASSNTVLYNCDDNLNSCLIRLSMHSFIEGIKCFSLALSNMPNVPVNFNSSIVAMFLAANSSKITSPAFSSNAKEMVSLSPRPNVKDKMSTLKGWLRDFILIQGNLFNDILFSGPEEKTSFATASGIKISLYSFCKRLSLLIRVNAIRGLELETVIIALGLRGFLEELFSILMKIRDLKIREERDKISAFYTQYMRRLSGGNFSFAEEFYYKHFFNSARGFLFSFGYERDNIRTKFYLKDFRLHRGTPFIGKVNMECLKSQVNQAGHDLVNWFYMDRAV